MIGPPLKMDNIKMVNNKSWRIFTLPEGGNSNCALWDCRINQQPCSILPKITQIDTEQSQIILEFKEGQQLAEKITKLKQQKDCFTEKELIRILHCLVIGLYHLHKINLLGRCFNTRNIILIDDGSIIFTKCGFAHSLIDQDEILQLPPEIVYQKQYDHRIDQWLLGVILYQCIIQKPVSTFKTDQLKEYQEFLYENQQKGNTFSETGEQDKENELIDLFSIAQMLLKFDPEARLSYEDLLSFGVFKDMDKQMRNEMITFYESKFQLHHRQIKERIKIREAKWYRINKLEFRSKSVQLQKKVQQELKRDRTIPLKKVQLIFQFSDQIKKQNQEKFQMLNLGLYCLNLYEQLRIEFETQFPKVHFFGFCISQIIIIKIDDLIENIAKDFSSGTEIQRCQKILKRRQKLESDCNIEAYQKKYQIPNLKKTIQEFFHQIKLQQEFSEISDQTKFIFVFSELFESILSFKLIRQKALKQVAYFNGVSKIDDVNQIQSFVELAPTFYKNKLLQEFQEIIQNQ